jgi:hypothetical protein
MAACWPISWVCFALFALKNQFVLRIRKSEVVCFQQDLGFARTILESFSCFPHFSPLREPFQAPLLPPPAGALLRQP